MVSITNQIDVVSPNAALQRAVPASIGLVESPLDWLHSAANEERGIVGFRNDTTIPDQRETKLVKTTLN